jgi:hypothetical protein
MTAAYIIGWIEWVLVAEVTLWVGGCAAGRALNRVEDRAALSELPDLISAERYLRGVE